MTKLMETVKKNWWGYLMLFFAGFYFVWLLLVLFGYGREVIVNLDYKALMTGVDLVRVGKGRELYDLGEQFLIQEKLYGVSPLFLPFKYSVGVLVLYFPLSFLSVFWAHKLWLVVNIGLLVGVLGYFWKKLKGFGLKSLWASVALINIPVSSALMLAQTSIVETVMALSLYLGLKKKRWELAGFIVGGLVMIKVQWLLLVPLVWMLVKNNWRWFKGLGLAVIVWVVAGGLIHGVGGFREYFRLLVGTEDAIYGSDVGSMFGVLGLLVSAGGLLGLNWSLVGYWGINILVYAVSVVWFWMWRNKVGLVGAFSVAIVLVSLLAGHVWSHSLSVWLVPVGLLLTEFEKKSDKLDGMMVLSLFLYPFLVSMIR